MQTIEQLPTAELLRLQRAFERPSCTLEAMALRGITAELGTRHSFIVQTEAERDLSEELEQEIGIRISAQSDAEEANRDARDTEEALEDAEDEIKKLKARIAELEAK